jgi:hypothetical protein
VRLLHFAMSTLGYGETLIGLALADQLVDAGVESHFVITPISETVVRRSGHPYTVIDAPMGGLARLIVDDLVREFRPDALVLSDYWTFVGIFERQFGIDSWFIEEYELPILPIDIWEWDRTDFVIDICGKTDHAVSRRIQSMPAHLRPVPITHPDDQSNPRAFPYRLWQDDERISRRTRGHLFTTFGLERADRLVLLTFAAWQQVPPANCTEDAARIIKAVPDLMNTYLRQLPDTTHFLIIGHVPPGLTQLPADRVHVMPPCSAKRFSTMLGLSDLVLSLNAGATTVARAVLADTPSMVVTNQFRVRDGAELDGVGAAVGGLSDNVRDWSASALPLYPFRMWPIGWHSFLDPVLSDNPYTDAVTHVELLDERGVVDGISAALYDKATIEQTAAARAEYRKAVAALAPTAEVFASAASRVGLRL